MITRDFQCLVASTKPSTAAYFVMNPDTSNGSGSQAKQLFGLISIRNKPSGATSTSTPGDLCAVGYYRGWDNNLKQHRAFFAVSGTAPRH